MMEERMGREMACPEAVYRFMTEDRKDGYRTAAAEAMISRWPAANWDPGGKADAEISTDGFMA